VLTTEKPGTTKVLATVSDALLRRLREYLARRNAELAPAKLTQSAAVEQAITEYLDREEGES
jgi:hypothetical protein